MPENELTSLPTERVVYSLKQTVREETNYGISIAIGSGITNFESFLLKKKDLEELMQNRILYGSNKILWLNSSETDCRKRSEIISKEWIRDMETILSSLERMDKEQLIESLNSYFNKLKQIKTAAKLEEAVQLLGIRIINRCMDIEGFGEEGESFKEVLLVTENSTDFYQLKDKMKIWVLNVLDRLNDANSMDEDCVQKAKEYIKTHLGENLTIKYIAQHVFMSPTYFSTYYKERTGETVLDYITKTRLKKAAELLQSTDLKVADISYKLGYHDTKYFSRLFKQKFGVTPSKYREKFFSYRQ